MPLVDQAFANSRTVVGATGSKVATRVAAARTDGRLDSRGRRPKARAAPLRKSGIVTDSIRAACARPSPGCSQRRRISYRPGAKSSTRGEIVMRVTPAGWRGSIPVCCVALPADFQSLRKAVATTSTTSACQRRSRRGQVPQRQQAQRYFSSARPFRPLAAKGAAVRLIGRSPIG